MKSRRQWFHAALAASMLVAAFAPAASAAETTSAASTVGSASVPAAVAEELKRRAAEAKKSFAEPPEEAAYEPNEKVRVIVELTDAPVVQELRKEGKTIEEAQGPQAARIQTMRKDLNAKQSRVIAAAKSAGVALAPRSRFTNTVNGFGAEVTYKDIKKLENMPGVKDVHIANKYERLRSVSVPHIGADGLTIGDTSLDGSGVTIAIVDSGIDYRHAEFGGDGTELAVGTNDLTGNGGYTEKVIGGYNHADQNNDVIDRNPESGSHGTHVAGIAAGDNGVAPGAKLLAEKVFSNDPYTAFAFSDDIIAGIDHAVAHGADIINMSLGSSYGYVDESDPEAVAVQRALDAGIPVIIAAGNDGHVAFPDEPTWKDYATVASPGTWPGALTVAASDYGGLDGNGSVTDFSSWGVTPDLGLKPNLTAPGSDIESTTYYPDTESYDGTSMATPHVAGVAALVKQAMETKGYDAEAGHIQAALANTALLLKDEGGVPYLPMAQGSGLVQADRAVATPVVVTSASGEPAVSVREIGGTTFTFALTAENLSDAPVTYELGATDVYTDVLTEIGVAVSAIDGANVGFGNATVQVPANGTANVQVTVTLPSSLTEGRYVGGWVTLTDANDVLPQLSVPYLGYYGDWNAVPMFNEKAAFTEEDNALNEAYPTAAMTELGWIDYEMGRLEPNKVAISPVTDLTFFPYVELYYSQLRYAERLVVEVVDAQGRVVRTTDNQSKLPKQVSYDYGLDAWVAFNYYVSGWDGTVFDPQTGHFEPAPDGEYTFRVRAISALGDPDRESDWQTLSFPVVVDTVAPEVSATMEPAGSGAVKLTVESTDEGSFGTWGYTVTVDGWFYDMYPADVGEITIEGLNNGLHEIEVIAIDYAGNYDVHDFGEVAVDSDFVYDGPYDIESATGEFDLSWEASEQVGDVEVYVDGELAATVPAGTETASMNLEAGYYEIELVGLSLDGSAELGTHTVFADVEAIADVEVTDMDGDPSLDINEEAKVTVVVKPEAIDRVEQIQIVIEQFLGEDVEYTFEPEFDEAGTDEYAIGELSSYYYEVDVFAVDAEGDFIGLGNEDIFVDSGDVTVIGIDEAYAEYRQSKFKVPDLTFTADIAVTDHVYRLDLMYFDYESFTETVIDSVYEPGGPVAIDLGGYEPSSDLGDPFYELYAVGFDEDGERLAADYFDVYVFDPGPIRTITSDWPAFRTEEATVEWSLAEGEEPPASYAYRVFGHNENYEIIEVDAGTLPGDATSATIDFSGFIDEDLAFVYLDALDGMGNVIGTYFYRVRTDNERPDFDLSWTLPFWGETVQGPDVTIRDLEVYDEETDVTVTANGEPIEPTFADIGEFYAAEVPLTLEEGWQTVRFVATDEAGNTARYDLKLLVDSEAPDIAFEHESTVYTTEDTFTVEGTVSDALSLEWVTLNGNDVFFDALGRNKGRETSVPVSHEIPLEEGHNVAVISAFDMAGNEAVETVTIVKGSAPAWPTGSSLTAEDVGRTSLTLDWTEATGADAYRVYRGSTLVGTVDAHTTELTVSGLTSGTEYTFSVQAGNEFGYTTNGPTATARTTSGGGGGGGGGGNEPPAPPENPAETPSGDAVALPADAVTADDETLPDGRTAKTFEVDANRLAAALAAAAGAGQGGRITIPLEGEGDVIDVRIPASALTTDAPTEDVALELAGENASYTLPLALLDLDAFAERLGADTAELNVRVTMAKLPAEQAEALADTAESAGGRLLGDAIEFTITVEANGASEELNDFGSTYVTRTITISQPVDGSEATAVVYDPATGAFSFVPARFVVENGQTRVVMMRNGNSVYAVVAVEKSFADTEGHWAKADIELLASKLILNGTSETAFTPDGDVTRAEFAAMLARGLGLTSSAEAESFDDVDGGDWFAGAVGAAVEAGIVTGYEDGTFRPNERVTREQMAAMIARALAFAGYADTDADGRTPAFADEREIGAWAKPAIAAAAKAGIVTGQPDGTFDPAANATRAQAATMLKRMLVALSFLS